MAVVGAGKAKVYVSGYDLTLFFRNANVSRMADMAETSAFLTGSKSFIPGMHDATIAGEALFDGAALAVDAILSPILGSETPAVIVHDVGNEVLGSVAHCMQATEQSYDVDSATDDVAVVSIEAQSNVGAERCLVHKVLGAVTTGANGTAIDNAVSSASGGVGYLQVTAQSGGGTLTVKVQHSVDNITFVDLITFTGTTALGAQRVAVAGTVNRYTRATHAITVGSATYMMAFGRKTF